MTRSAPLDWFADDPDAATGLRAFRTLLFAHGAVRVGARFAEDGGTLLAGIAGLLALATGATLRRGWERAGTFVAVWALSVEFALTPGVANHVYLELFCAWLLAFLDPDRKEEAPLLRAGLCWMTVLLLFHTGLQKLLHGTWFRAEFLSWMIAHREPFQAFFGLLLPEAELARLAAEDGVSLDSGPYRTSFLPVVLLSNAVWLAEMGLPALMLWPRTRRVAGVVAAAFVFSIQLGARETMFALLYSQLCLLVVSGGLYRRIAPVFACVYAYLVLVLLGLAPGGPLLKPEGL